MESHPIFTDAELDMIVKWHNACGGETWERAGSTVVFASNRFIGVGNRTLELVWKSLYSNKLRTA